MSDSLLQQGIEAARAGQREQAHTLLMQAVRAEPQNESAWLWLSAQLDDPEQRRYCLQRVLALNPQNQSAQQALAALQPPAALAEREAITHEPAAPESPMAPRSCPNCGSTVAAQARFCTSCGSALDAAPTAPATSQPASASGGAQCAMVVGFLAPHRCDNPALASCTQCARSYCDEHVTLMPAGLVCLACQQGLEQPVALPITAQSYSSSDILLFDSVSQWDDDDDPFSDLS